MIVTYPLNGIDYNAEDAQLYTCTRTSGVYSAENEFLVVSVSGRTVEIGDGRAWISPSKFLGMATAIKGQESVSVPTADGLLPRKDLIVYRWDKAKNKCYLYVISGSPSTNPELPAISRTEEIYDLGLYEVLVPPSSVEVDPGNITSVMMDESLCGLMRDGVTGMPTGQVQQQAIKKINSIDLQLNTFLEEKTNEVNQYVYSGQQQIDQFISENTTEFDTWFEDVQDQLGGDVAGNLMNEINLLKESPANATASYSDGVVSITTDPINAKEIYFYAPSDFLDTDTYTLNGKPLVITDLNNEPIFDAWKTGSPVKLIVVDGVGFFKSGGGGASDTLPPMVSGLKAVASNQKITVSWENPVSDSLAGVLVVHKAGEIPQRPSDGSKSDAQLAGTVEITGLENGTKYYIRVFPYNAKKQYQTLYDGAVVSATPSEGPEQATDVLITGSDGNPVITWRNPTDPTYTETIVVQKENSFPVSVSDGTEIYRGTGETVTASGLVQGTVYYFGVFTVNESGGTRGAVTESYEILNPAQVTGLTVTGEGGSPTISWENPTGDKWYRNTVIMRKIDSASTGVDDGDEVYRGNGESFVDSGLQSYTNYYYTAFTLNALDGYGEGVTADVYRFDFPAEPTSWSLVEKITASQTFTIPEDGWFKVAAVGGGGTGGAGDGDRTQDSESWETHRCAASGGGAGSGGIAISVVPLYKGNTLTLSVNGSVKIAELSLSAGIGGNGGSAYARASSSGSITVRAGTGGKGGTASGGNLYTTNGNGGASGSTNKTGSSIAGGAGGTLSVDGETSAGGAGGRGDDSSPGAGGAGSAAYVAIYRGNTNIASPAQVSSMSLMPENQSITVQWENSGDPTQAGTTVVYNTDHVPVSPSDGVSYDVPMVSTFSLSDDKNAQSYEIAGLENQKPVYVALYPYNSDGKHGIAKSDVEVPKVNTWYSQKASVDKDLETYTAYYTKTQEVMPQ